MVLNAKKFIKLKQKVENKLIGVGTTNGLGCDLTINRYVFTRNNYGDFATTTLAEITSTKGIILESNDYQLSGRLDVSGINDRLKLYIPVDTTVENTETSKYEFVLNDKTYVLVDSHIIGQVCNLSGVVREVTLEIKK